MGMAKRQMEEDEERGWSSTGGAKFCCADHVEDYALEALISEEASSKVCTYCGREADGPIAVDVDLIVERFAESLPYEWGEANNEGLPVEGGEYVWEPIDTYDLVTEHLDGPLNDGDLIYNVVGALSDQAWVQRNFYQVSEGERLIFGWADFAEIVKQHRRFFFSRYREKEDEDPYERESISPGEMLRLIGEAVRDAGLVRTLEPGESLFRARVHEVGQTPQGAAALGPPDTKYVISSSRMSPAGVPILYAARDGETAREEAMSATPDGEAVTVGEFVSVQPLRVVDLSQQPAVPSLLDPEARHLRPGHIFLRHFVDEIAKPFVHDERMHIEYVPTQIVTEWFRVEYDGGVDGILYGSPRNDGGVNAALFVMPDQCRDPEAIDETTLLEFRGASTLSTRQVEENSWTSMSVLVSAFRLLKEPRKWFSWFGGRS
jgi:HEPN/RES N-terminal domain 1/RES domain